MKYAQNMLANMQIVCNYMLQICWFMPIICKKNIQKICNYIDCISGICKKYAGKICRNKQVYMQNMHKSIHCIYCIYIMMCCIVFPTLLMLQPDVFASVAPLPAWCDLGCCSRTAVLTLRKTPAFISQNFAPLLRLGFSSSQPFKWILMMYWDWFKNLFAWESSLPALIQDLDF